MKRNLDRPVAASGLALLATSLALIAQPAWADAKDDAMLKLAATSGCTACHQVASGAKGPQGLPPVGPAWQDVAAKYRGDKHARKELTKIVLAGSNPYESHWKGKASGLAMPPNKVAISEADASKLVGWILGLAPAKP